MAHENLNFTDLTDQISLRVRYVAHSIYCFQIASAAKNKNKLFSKGPRD